MVIGYVLFFVAGLAFGYAAPGGWKWAPLLFPTVLALGAFFREGGVDGEVVVRLVVALVLTAVGVLLGRMIEERAGSETARAG
jgi:hypothetical protein